MPTEVEKEAARKEGADISSKFMRKHPEFRGSKEISGLLEKWFKKHDVEFNLENLETAYRAVETDRMVERLVNLDLVKS